MTRRKLHALTDHRKAVRADKTARKEAYAKHKAAEEAAKVEGSRYAKAMEARAVEEGMRRAQFLDKCLDMKNVTGAEWVIDDGAQWVRVTFKDGGIGDIEYR